MGQADYANVLENMRLADGTLFPMPITLPVHKKYESGQKLALRDIYGTLIAVMTVNDAYEWDLEQYAKSIYGAVDDAHPFMMEIRTWGPYNISGRLEVLSLPDHKDFAELRHTPTEVRKHLMMLGHYGHPWCPNWLSSTV